MLLAELNTEVHPNGSTEIFVKGDLEEYTLLIAPTHGLAGLGIDTMNGVNVTREGARVLAPLTAAALDVALDAGNKTLVNSLASVQRQVKSKL